MANPASAPANSFILKGITTIRWGTDGFLKDAGLAGGLNTGAIVVSCKQSRRVSEMQIENNSGFEAVEIILIQGQDYDITCIDDSANTWPDTGGKLLLQGPDDQAPIEFLVVDDNYAAERKKEGQRTIKAKCFQAFTVS